MRGTMLIFEPKGFQPRAAQLAAPPDEYMLTKAIGGYAEIVSGFETIDYHSQIRRCVAYCNANGRQQRLPTNQWATVLLTRALKRARKDTTTDFLLHGPVVVIVGDHDFMEALGP